MQGSVETMWVLVCCGCAGNKASPVADLAGTTAAQRQTNTLEAHRVLAGIDSSAVAMSYNRQEITGARIEHKLVTNASVQVAAALM